MPSGRTGRSDTGSMAARTKYTAMAIHKHAAGDVTYFEQTDRLVNA